MQLVLSDEGQFFLKKQIVIELDLPVGKEQILQLDIAEILFLYINTVRI
jgi:hypothetical protein